MHMQFENVKYDKMEHQRLKSTNISNLKNK